MTNEEMERTMQFIVEQQAQFTTNIQKVEEAQLRDAPRLQRLEAAFVELVELARTTDERLDSLTDSHRRLAEAQARTEGRVVELAEATERQISQLAAHAEARLSALTVHVDQLAERTGASLSALAAHVDQLADRTEVPLSTLAAHLDRVALAQTRTDESLSRLIEAQTRTDEGLSKLTEIVGQYIRTSRDGSE